MLAASSPASVHAQPADKPSPAPSAPSPPAPSEPLDDDTQSCVDAFERAQLRRRSGKLLESRRELLLCARAECPQVIAEKCVPWLSEVSAAIPSVVIAARDPAGRDTAEVRVTVDGRKLAERLDGRAIEIDPGMRRFRFEYPNARAVEKQLLIAQGVKARTIDFQFVRFPGAVGGNTQPISPLAIVGFSVAGAGLLLGAISGGIALKRGDELAQRCPDKRCTTTDPNLPDDYAEAQTIAHVSTVGFAVAGAGTVVGIIGLAIGAGEETRAAPRVSFLIGPTRLTLAGWF